MEKLIGLDGVQQISEQTLVKINSANAQVTSQLTAHSSDAKIHRSSIGYDLTLSSSGWSTSSPYTQTVTATGVTVAGKEVVNINPANKASRTLWRDCGLDVNDITTNGKITFTAETKPTSNILLIVEVKDIGRS